MNRRRQTEIVPIGQIINGKSYAEKLRDPRWQRKRLERLNLSSWQCDSCKASTSELQVHHRWYLKGLEPWDYDCNQLETLCNDCHELATEIQAELKDHLSRSSLWAQQTMLQAAKGCKHPSFFVEFIRRDSDGDTFGVRAAACYAMAVCAMPNIAGRVLSLVDWCGELHVFEANQEPLTGEQEDAFHRAWEICGESQSTVCFSMGGN